MNTNLSAANWEALWSPYDQPTYTTVLEHIRSSDIVLEIGAGDLRLARMLAARACKVYAIEIKSRLLNQAKTQTFQPKDNLFVMCADARLVDFPADLTVGVLLMRHCLHFQLYAQKLKEAGAERLVTNARWRMGVECIDLHSRRIPYQDFRLGWYACWCGAAGVKPGPVDQVSSEIMTSTHEVLHCPQCA